MPLFEVETDAHIIITWAANDDDATHVANHAYPGERVLRLTKRRAILGSSPNRSSAFPAIWIFATPPAIA